MKRLIINADDFGLHPAVNEGIIRGHLTGCLTSTSLMAVGEAFVDAVALLGRAPDLGVGIHLTLNMGEKPVSDPVLISTIVNQEGWFLARYPEFIQRLVRGQVQLSEVRRELAAQIGKITAQGIKISHIDSHQHLHVLPGVIDVVIELAKEFGIRAIRIPGERYFFTGGYPVKLSRITGRGGLTFLAGLARRKVRQNKISAPDYFFGLLAGGNLEEKYLLNIIHTLPDGVSEVMLHPAADARQMSSRYDWQYNWEGELAAVTADVVKAAVTGENINLISFNDLKNSSG